ncbi:MAG: C40 family peptidase [Acidobacteria bacterium]|nr:C40 family peptidase [Acidobacteriota bacterium]
MWNVAVSKGEQARNADVLPASDTHSLHIRKLTSRIAARSGAMASAVTENAMQFLGVRYVFGGTSARGFDCSGYVQHVFAMMGVHLPRMADEQYYAAKKFTGELKPGDLVFFHTYAPGVSHVGISLGGDRFVHASNSGVHVSSLNDSYYGPRYLGARRVLN